MNKCLAIIALVLMPAGMALAVSMPSFKITATRSTPLAVTPQLSSGAFSGTAVNDFVASTFSSTTVLSGTITGSTTIADIVYNVVHAPTYQTNCQFQLSSSFVGGMFSPAFVNLTPSIGTVDPSTYDIIYVSNGTTTVNVSSNGRTRQISCPISITSGGPDIDTFSNFAPASLAQAMVAQANALISGKTPSAATEDLYTTYSTSTHTYVRNASNLLHSIDLTCLPASFNGVSQYGGILVASDTIITAHHTSGGNVGISVDFLDNSNNTYTRTIVSQSGPIDGADVEVQRLNSPLPSAITPCSMLPYSAVYSQNVFTLASINSDNIPAFYTDQFAEIHMGIFGLDGATKYPFYSFTIFNPSNIASWTPWWRAVIGGDSSSGVFAVLGGKLVALGSWTSADLIYGQWGYSMDWANFTTDINAAMTSLGSVNQITTVDLSAYPTY